MGTTPTTAPVVRADSSDSIAMIVEIVFALFGILGMGWLYAGNFLVSILAFAAYAILVFIEAGVIAVSLAVSNRSVCTRQAPPLPRTFPVALSDVLLACPCNH
jgi:hypothetical protein